MSFVWPRPNSPWSVGCCHGGFAWTWDSSHLSETSADSTTTTYQLMSYWPWWLGINHAWHPLAVDFHPWSIYSLPWWSRIDHARHSLAITCHPWSSYSFPWWSHIDHAWHPLSIICHPWSSYHSLGGLASTMQIPWLIVIYHGAYVQLHSTLLPRWWVHSEGIDIPNSLSSFVDLTLVRFCTYQCLHSNLDTAAELLNVN